MSNGKDVVKIPIRSLDEYKIRYNYDKINMSAKATATAKSAMSSQETAQIKAGRRKRPGAGDQAGEDYYEAEVSLMDLEEALFQELELPNLQQRKGTISSIPISSSMISGKPG